LDGEGFVCVEVEDGEAALEKRSNKLGISCLLIIHRRILIMMKSLQETMKNDWDEMAKKNPYYYVLTHKEFEDPSAVDVEKFFASGKEEVDRILDRMGVCQNSTWSVLDIGCGLGRLTRRLNDLFGHVVGVDVSSEMVKGAKEANPDLEFRQVSGVDLQEFENESFDFVFSYIVLQHCPDQAIVLKYLAEFARVLKKGGTAVFQLPTSFYPRWKRVYWRAMRSKQADSNRDRSSFRGCCLSAGKIQREAFQLGLQSEVVLNEGTWGTLYSDFQKV